MPQNETTAWIRNPQASSSPPNHLRPEQDVEVMAADGDTRRGKAETFDWGWHREEECRISQYRVLTPFELMDANNLVAFIKSKRHDITTTEANLVEMKTDLAAAMRELNNQLSDCGVTLNEVMKPTTGPIKR